MFLFGSFHDIYHTQNLGGGITSFLATIWSQWWYVTKSAQHKASKLTV